MTDSQASSEAIEALLERIRRLENADMGGWISSVEERWSFAGADDPSYTVSIPGDLTWKYWPGQRVRLQQAGGAVKHFIITGAGYSSPNTVLILRRHGLRPGQLAHHRALLLGGQGTLWFSSE